MLVIGGSPFSGGPVRIAPGSGSKSPEVDEIALVVEPTDCDPEEALCEHTRFRINEAERIDRTKLRGCLCRLKPPKLRELDLLKRRGL